MGILDGIVEWIAEQVMNGLDLISVSVLGALGCDMGTFLRYFPAAETMYHIFVATGIGLVLLNWVWQLFKNFGIIAGVEAEDPVKLSIRSVLFIGLIYYCDQITEMVLAVGGTPYSWILSSDLPPLNFADWYYVKKKYKLKVNFSYNIPFFHPANLSILSNSCLYTFSYSFGDRYPQ